MAASIKGRQVVWGVPAAVITSTHDITTSGIVQDVSWGAGGETDETVDEDGDICTRVDHGAKNSLSLTVICEADTVIPAKGDELTFAAAVDGVPLDEGRVVVDTAEVTYAAAGKKTISVTATQYPDMEADPV